MPNHVTNYVAIVGKDAEKVLPVITTEARTDVTFEKLVPMPAELLEVVSPTMLVETDEEAAAANAEFAGYRTPGRQSVAALTHERAAALTARYGAFNWHDWALLHWGTKWDAYQTERVELVDGGKRLNLVFTTAWSPPDAVLQKIADDFDVAVYLAYDDEGTSGVELESFGAPDIDAYDFFEVRTVVDFQ
jgi:hypothetical protein